MTKEHDHHARAAELNIDHGDAVQTARRFCDHGGPLNPCDKCVFYAVQVLNFLGQAKTPKAFTEHQRSAAFKHATRLIIAARRDTLGPNDRALTANVGTIPTDEIVRVADWLLDQPATPDTIDIMVAERADPVATISPNPFTVEQYQALRHLATVANDLIVGFFGEDGDPAAVDLDDAVDHAYKALDWPRYPEAGA